MSGLLSRRLPVCFGLACFVLVCFTLAAVFVAPLAHAQSARVAAARQGAEYLASVQNADGSFPHGGGSHRTAEGIWAIISTGLGGAPIELALDYIEVAGIDDESNAGEVGMIVAGLVAASENPNDFRGVDYLAVLESLILPSGEFQAPNFFSNVLGALGYLAAGQTLPDAAFDYIDTHACPGGGFGFGKDCAFGADTDTSAYVLNIFVAAERQSSDPVMEAARVYLLGRQNTDGGFGYSADFPETSADSTGIALTALAALGLDDAEAVAALLELQEDSGAFRRTAADTAANDWSTVNALPGLAGVSLPVPPADDLDPIDPIDEPTPSPQPSAAPATPARASVLGTSATPGPVLPATGDSPQPGAAWPAALVLVFSVIALAAAGHRAQHHR